MPMPKTWLRCACAPCNSVWSSWDVSNPDRPGRRMRVLCNSANAIANPSGISTAIAITGVFTLSQTALTRSRLPSTDFQGRSVGSLRSGEPDQNGEIDTKISASRGSSGAHRSLEVPLLLCVHGPADAGRDHGVAAFDIRCQAFLVKLDAHGSAQDAHQFHLDAGVGRIEGRHDAVVDGRGHGGIQDDLALLARSFDDLVLFGSGYRT